MLKHSYMGKWAFGVRLTAAPAMASTCSPLLALLTVWSLLVTTSAVPAAAPEQCGPSGCTLNNAYMIWNDRIPCKAAKAVYPVTEAEIVAEVAAAVQANQKVKAATVYGHSIPKGACPGSDSGVIISTRHYKKIVDCNREANTVEIQSGITWRELLDGIAAQCGLTVNLSPLFDGVTLAGAIANSVHGSSLWGKGGAVHEYVVGMRIVTPANASEGYAKVRVISSDDPDLNAAKVHLGVLGIVSTVTLQAEPMFKRSVTFENVGKDDELTGAKVLEIAKQYQYAVVMWYPGVRQVTYQLDSRVSISTVGDGKNNYFGMQSQARSVSEVVRAAEEVADKTGNEDAKCKLAFTQVSAQQAAAFGFEKVKGIPALDLPGPFPWPVIGKQNLMANAGGCQRDPKPLFYCPWDGRIKGLVYYDAGAALPLRNLGAFIDDVKALRNLAPAGAYCDLDLYTGILMRFTKKTEAYMGTAQEDSVMLDFGWSRAGRDGDPTAARLDMDIFQELEQLAFDKYGARPHWGKNRNVVFNKVWEKYPNVSKFLAVKNKFDPQGLFSSEWSDAILGISGSPVTDAAGCAVEGMCKCSRNEHCATTGAGKYNTCTSGRLYSAAHVCR